MKKAALIVFAGLLLAASCDKGATGGDEPSPPRPSEAVDLGLSVKWAACNIGASKPEENGGYYQWAGTEDVTSTSIDLDLDYPYHIGQDENTGWTKYIPSNKASFWSGSGDPDNKKVLDPNDDVAHVKLGGTWRMPTDAEWTELRENCTWTWTDNYNGTGVAGRIVTGKKPGYTDRSIFLPAAGYRSGGGLNDVGFKGEYWSSSLSTGLPYFAFSVRFGSGSVIKYYDYRCHGRAVRPVTE